ncbi:AI-2E family transporter [Oceanisphaera sp. IT1-181]|uniref:AI-2E family transporter n=1 Tax=Oceanisphaera sp. IT1-181 TaxID=3081199 RepID=UPI0029C9D600|nr:AI-2E family transporter [Oceanisphaera sp. IT1-181]
MIENSNINPTPKNQNSFLTLIGVSVIIAILYFAKVVILPVAMAIMLSFLLAPLIIRLQRYGIPRLAAIVSTLVIAFSLIAVIAWSIGIQVINLAEQLPRYEITLLDKIRQINSKKQVDSPLSRAGEVVDKLRKELNNEDQNLTTETAAKNNSQVTAVEPVAVEIKPTKKNIFESFAEMAGPFIGPLGTSGLVIIFVIAILFQREDLRERLIRIIGGSHLNVATEAIDDAAKRISRYLTMQLLVNSSYGIPISVGLYFIGIPNAILWGFLAILLRFIPYIGPWIAAAFPIALAFAIDPGWSTLFLTLGLFITLEIISNNVVEPWLYGVSTGISNFALMVAAVFWTWLWGPVGLFLSTPLTVCVVVLGNYVPSLSFISVLLGSVPALKPNERLYQRMLAMDYNEMLSLSRDYVKQNSMTDYYDQLLIPALSAAEVDRQTGGLAEIRQTFILQNIPELIDELYEKDSNPPFSLTRSARVLIVAAKDDMDELAGKILACGLEEIGIIARLHSAISVTSECAELIKQDPIEVICISALPPGAFVPARQLSRRLASGCAGVKSIVGVWSHGAQANDLQSRISTVSDAIVVTTLQDAIDKIQILLTVPEEVQPTSAPIPEDEEERLKDVLSLNLTNADPDETFDSITRALAKAFNVPISLVSIIDTDRQFWKSHVGLPEDLALAGESPRDTSVCGHVVAQNKVLIIEDITQDKRFANNSFLKSRGIRFYAGVPLRSHSGHAVGSLCVIDTKPRNVTEKEIALISKLAEQLMESVNRSQENTA